jgi:hypothetical protein
MKYLHFYYKFKTKMYFNNIVEYFDSCCQPIDLTNESTFYKEAYAVYLRYKQNDTTLRY